MDLAEIKYTAVVMEYERGWGSKVDEIREFDSETERDEFIKKVNFQNLPGPAPDYYLQASPGNTKIIPINPK